MDGTAILLLSLWTFAATEAEIVSLLDTTPDVSTRNLNAGLSAELTFTLHHSRGDVDLTLRENQRFNRNPDFYDLTLDANGELLVVKEDVQDDPSVRYYQDPKHGAFFTVVCQRLQSAPCRRELKGNIFIEGVEHSLEPARDEWSGNGVAGSPHTLSVINRDETLHGNRFRDLVVTPESDDEGRSDLGQPRNDQRLTDALWELEHGEQERKMAEVEDDLQELLMQVEEMKKKKKKNKRNPAKIVAYGIEILLLIDFAIFQRFEKKFPDKDELRKEAKQYYSHIMNGVDLMYGSIQDADASFYVTIAHIYLITNKNVLPWTGDSETTISMVDVLYDFSDWKYKHTKNGNLGDHDHAVLLTGAKEKNGVVGIAFVRTMCDDRDSVSVNRDIGFFQTTATIAHELGHSLGAGHDSGRSCPADAYFIMTAYVYDIEKYTTFLNPWRFSICSIFMFKYTVKKLSRKKKNCLLNRAVIWDQEEWNKHLASLPGQLYSETEQCTFVFGPEADMCTPENINTPKICRDLGCRQSINRNCTNHVAAHGTPCSQGNYCFEGLCIKAGTESSPEIVTERLTSESRGLAVSRVEASRCDPESSLEGEALEDCYKLIRLLGAPATCRLFAKECCRLCR